MNIPDQSVAYLSYAVGGSPSSIDIEDHGASDHLYPHIDHPGGIRGKVRGFSRASRRNLLRHLASINRKVFRASKGKLISVTLTYPREYPEDPEVCKHHLKAFQKRLHRRYGAFAAFWRMGIQKRGAWHFHLLLFVPRSFGRIDKLRDFVSSAWYEVCGKVSEGHLRAGTRVEEIKNWKQATSWGRPVPGQGGAVPGRIGYGQDLGHVEREVPPIEWETVKISLRNAYRIRRVFRKLAKRRGIGSLRRLTVFVRYENVVRLLQFLGYFLE